MSGNYENNNPQRSSGQDRDHVVWKLQQDRVSSLAFLFGDVPRTPEHAEYVKHQEDLQTRGEEPASVR